MSPAYYITNRIRMDAERWPDWFRFKLGSPTYAGVVHAHRCASKSDMIVVDFPGQPVELNQPRIFDERLESALAANGGVADLYTGGFATNHIQALNNGVTVQANAGLPSVLVVCDWASSGSPFPIPYYSRDRTRVRRSIGMIADTIVRTARLPKTRTLRLNCHSLGADGVAKAIVKVAASTDAAVLEKVSQVTFFAPDIDEAVYADFAKVAARFKWKTRLYACSWDRALWLSHFVNDYEPIGSSKQRIFTAPGLETIVVRNGHGYFGHSYIYNSSLLHFDLNAALVHGLEPKQRNRLEERQTREGKKFWIL